LGGVSVEAVNMGMLERMDQIDVAGIEIDLEVRGDGPVLLYLHPEHYRHLHTPFVDELAKHWKVYAPRHPGFDGRRPPKDFRRVEDIAYLYLDLIEQYSLTDVTILGASFGGWIGLEMAVRNTSRMAALTLIAPVGVKLGEREERDFADLTALPNEMALRALFSSSPADFGTFSETQMIGVAQDRQYLAYYAWKPYLHNPSLRRWLHRINVPTRLLWGEDDRYVTADYGNRLAARIPSAEMTLISGAGHYPQIEKMNETINTVVGG